LKLAFSARFPRPGEERNRLKAPKFSNVPKAFIVKRGEEGVPYAEICREAGIIQAPPFNRREIYAGPMRSDMKDSE